MKKTRIGIFGYCRGASYVDSFLQNNADIVAVCDKRKDRLESAKKKLGDGLACYENFDDFIEHGLDAVFIANYFHEHTEYIIKCLERNIHALSECVSNATMAEGVKLVEVAEKSKAFFMLAENYPYMLFNQEMKKVYDTVRQAPLAGIAVTKAGVPGKEIDAAARKVIEDAGYGPYFGHGYGHSLGLEIHEAPNPNPGNPDPMPENAVASAEPGIYLPGKFGVRIEDVTVFKKDGCENITHSPKNLIIV